MLELYSSLLRQNYKAIYIATPKLCDKIIKPIVNVPSCSVSLQMMVQLLTIDEFLL